MPNVTKPFLSELSGNQLGFLHCMIIVSQGGKYEAAVNTIPLVGAAEGLMKRDRSFRIQKRRDIEIIQCYLKDDYLKELVSTLYDLPDSQQSRQYYLGYIENVFKQCSKGGGMCIHSYICTCDLILENQLKCHTWPILRIFYCPSQ